MQSERGVVEARHGKSEDAGERERRRIFEQYSESYDALVTDFDEVLQIANRTVGRDLASLGLDMSVQVRALELVRLGLEAAGLPFQEWRNSFDAWRSIRKPGDGVSLRDIRHKLRSNGSADDTKQHEG